MPLEEWGRDFQMIAELPYGQQAQVDFGFYNMRTSTGKTKKVQFFCLVLSRSRYKYVVFTDTPYTSETVVKAHELAFEYLGGIPQEIVYDQDRLFLVSENLGELMLTERFRCYVSQRSFKTYFCRAADPQSKGKVENVVKYVKQNFLAGRSFKDLETLNQEVCGWLSRTANALAHGTTKKVPAREMETEKQRIRELCSTFYLTGICAGVEQYITTAEQQGMGFIEFTSGLLEIEAVYRRERDLSKRLKTAWLPQMSNLEL